MILLFKPPPKRRVKAIGRPPVKGRSLPVPCEVVATKKRDNKLRVRWHGGGWRNVEVITGVDGWFKSGEGLVSIRWGHVRDLDSTHRDDVPRNMGSPGIGDDSRMGSANGAADSPVLVQAGYDRGFLLRHDARKQFAFLQTIIAGKGNDHID
ncbi:hypothetical protein [Rubripirellula reticaptiva]|uniref:Uncharacterized protein n=1 Tax=Rubripirellula reticaptiva TaxID=2528013 RepID=A0A5C6FAJ9_9BACT|nr:hypothetical protein [Rubripirellula reticaptiva]TWU58408.1 hypothetical protein Poly59_13190 [Rubripirellula reticaptiva]